MGVFLTSCPMGQLGNYRFNYNPNLAVAPAKADGAGEGNYRFNYNPNLAVAPAKADGAGEGDRVYAIFMLFGPFLPLFFIKNI